MRFHRYASDLLVRMQAILSYAILLHGREHFHRNGVTVRPFYISVDVIGGSGVTACLFRGVAGSDFPAQPAEDPQKSKPIGLTSRKGRKARGESRMLPAAGDDRMAACNVGRKLSSL